MNEFTDLRAVAILLLFLVHSNLQLSSPVLAVQLTQWFLSAFFFVSGYLAYQSFCHKGQQVKPFLWHRFLSLYVPFVLVMAFYVVADNIVLYGVNGFLSHASLLSVFANYNDGVYDMRQFWFIPVLLAFSVLLVLVYRYVTRPRWRYLIVAGVFSFNLACYAFGAPLLLQWNFGLYLLVFAFGYEFSQHNLFSQLRRRWLVVALAAVALIALYLTVFVFVNWDVSSVLGRLNYYGYQWIENTVFGVSTVLLVLLGLGYLRRRFPNAKIYGAINVLGACTLYIYFFEGFVSTRLCLLVFGTTQYYSLSGWLLAASVLIRIAAVAAVAVTIKLVQDKAANHIKTVYLPKLRQ